MEMVNISAACDKGDSSRLRYAATIGLMTSVGQYMFHDFLKAQRCVAEKIKGG